MLAHEPLQLRRLRRVRDPRQPNEQRRFASRIEKALDRATGIRDEFYWSAAFHQIVSALIKDKQLDRAQETARQITVDMIYEKAEAEIREARGLVEV